MGRDLLIRYSIPVFRTRERGQKVRKEVKSTTLRKIDPDSQFDYTRR
jgi:hypothetical protein